MKSADQILVLRNGRIVQHGRHDELIDQDGPYREIYDVELRDQEEAFEQERKRLEREAQKAEPAPASAAGGGGAA